MVRLLLAAAAVRWTDSKIMVATETLKAEAWFVTVRYCGGGEHVFDTIDYRGRYARCPSLNGSTPLLVVQSARVARGALTCRRRRNGGRGGVVSAQLDPILLWAPAHGKETRVSPKRTAGWDGTACGRPPAGAGHAGRRRV